MIGRSLTANFRTLSLQFRARHLCVDVNDVIWVSALDGIDLALANI